MNPNFSPYGNGPTTSAEDDFEALERLKPKTYKAMEDPHFMKSKYKSLYAPIKCTVSSHVNSLVPVDAIKANFYFSVKKLQMSTGS